MEYDSIFALNTHLHRETLLKSSSIRCNSFLQRTPPQSALRDLEQISVKMEDGYFSREGSDTAVDLCTLPPEICQVQGEICMEDCAVPALSACEASGDCVEQCVVVACDNPSRQDCAGACDTECDWMDWLGSGNLQHPDSDCCQCIPMSISKNQQDFSGQDALWQLQSTSTTPLFNYSQFQFPPFSPGETSLSATTTIHSTPKSILPSTPCPQPTENGRSGTRERVVCLWGACRDTFSSQDDLVTHVNWVHLQHALHAPPISQPTSGLGYPLACHWANCTEQPLGSALRDNPLSAPDADYASLYALANHLLHDHLGLASTHLKPDYAPAVPMCQQPLHMPPFSDSSFSMDMLTGSMASSGANAENIVESTSDAHSLPSTTTPSSFSPTPSSAPTSTLSASEAHLRPQSSSSSKSPGLKEKSNIDSLQAFASSSSSTSQPPNCLWIGCDKQFTNLDELSSHIISDHVGGGKGEYACGWQGCNRNGPRCFTSKQKILRHLQSHTGHRPFQCSLCGQHFSEAATLQQHMRRHTSEKPYICDFPGCEKSFAVAGALTIHKRTHSGDKPFKCSHCDRAFAESSNLSKHLRTHTGAKPYSCPEPGCNKKFSRPDQLNRHKAIHLKKRDRTNISAGEPGTGLSLYDNIIEED